MVCKKNAGFMKQEYVGTDAELAAISGGDSPIWFHLFCVFTNPDKMFLQNLRDLSCLQYIDENEKNQDEMLECMYCKIKDCPKHLRSSEVDGRPVHFHSMCAWLDGAEFDLNFDVQFSKFNDIPLDSWQRYSYWNFHPIEFQIRLR